MGFSRSRIRILGFVLVALVATLGVQKTAVAGAIFKIGVLSADGSPAAGFGLNVVGTVQFSSSLDPLPLLGGTIAIDSLSLTGTLFGSAISFDETDILASAHATTGSDLVWFTIAGTKLTDDGLFAFVPANAAAVFPPFDIPGDLEVWAFDTTGALGIGPRNAGRCVALTSVACPSAQLRAFFVAVPASEPSTVLLALAGIAAFARRRQLTSKS